MSRAGTGDSGNRPGSPIPIESRRIRSITFLLALLALACGAKPPEPMDKIRQHILAARTSHRDLLAGLKIDFTRTQGWSQASQHEYESRLEIRGDGTIAYLSRCTDTDRLAPGRFRGTAPQTELRAFLKRLEADLRRPGSSQPPSADIPLSTLRITLDGSVHELVWRDGDDAEPSEVWDQIQLDLDRWEKQARAPPLWSLELEPELTVKSSRLRGVLRFHNRGGQPLRILDPTSPAPPDQLQLQLRYAPKPNPRPGITELPLELQTLDLASVPKRASPRWIEIAPHSSMSLEIDRPAPPQFPKKWVAAFTYISYATDPQSPEAFQGAVFSKEFEAP